MKIIVKTLKGEKINMEVGAEDDVHPPHNIGLVRQKED